MLGNSGDFFLGRRGKVVIGPFQPKVGWFWIPGWLVTLERIRDLGAFKLSILELYTCDGVDQVP